MSKKHWSRVGEVYREAIDHGSHGKPTATQRERLAQDAARLSLEESRRTPARWWRWAVVGAALAASAALVIWLRVLPQGPEPPRCHTADGKRVDEGQELVARSKGLALRFGDGTRVDLDSGSALLTKRLAANEVELVLKRGRLKADVQKAKGRVWRYRAGPYQVRVLGTAFDIAWDRAKKRFRVDVKRGAVHVSGGKIAGAGERVTAGQGIEATPQAARIIQREVTSPDASVAPADARAVEPDQRIAAPSTPRKPSGHRGLSHRWRKLMLQGHHDAAWREVKRVGLSRLYAKASGADLLLLADLSRARGDGPWARRTLLSIRKRFAGKRAGALAAFELGRVAARKGDHAQAERRFGYYLAVQPRGKRAADALGRQMVALGKLGRRAEARRKAKAYLAAYPKGAYARVARAIAKD